MYEWNFEKLKNINEFDNSFFKIIHKIFLDGFGLSEGWSIDGVQKMLNTSAILGLLMGEEREILGYAFYSVPPVPLNQNYLLWEDGICLRKEAQGKRGSGQVIEKACAIFPDRRFGWLGGRTQNPVVIKRYSKFGTVFPFDILYDTTEGKLVMNYLLEYIAEVSEVYNAEKLDLSNGICRGIYPEGRLGDYPVEVSGTDRFEKQLRLWKFQRDGGDAVIVISKLNQPFLVGA
jgi:hypothetical protein